MSIANGIQVIQTLPREQHIVSRQTAQILLFEFSDSELAHLPSGKDALHAKEGELNYTRLHLRRSPYRARSPLLHTNSMSSASCQ
jgi:hypothetical protein